MADRRVEPNKISYINGLRIYARCAGRHSADSAAQVVRQGVGQSADRLLTARKVLVYSVLSVEELIRLADGRRELDPVARTSDGRRLNAVRCKPRGDSVGRLLGGLAERLNLRSCQYGCMTFRTTTPAPWRATGGT